MNPEANNKKLRRKLPPPFSIRFTDAERARLEADAGPKPLAAHIRTKLFDGAVSAGNRPRQKARRPNVDDAALARLLAALGQSRIASNLNQIAKAANLGTLPVTPEVVEELLDICLEIRAMRRDLVAALGLEPEGKR